MGPNAAGEAKAASPVWVRDVTRLVAGKNEMPGLHDPSPERIADPAMAWYDTGIRHAVPDLPEWSRRGGGIQSIPQLSRNPDVQDMVSAYSPLERRRGMAFRWSCTSVT